MNSNVLIIASIMPTTKQIFLIFCISTWYKYFQLY